MSSAAVDKRYLLRHRQESRWHASLRQRQAGCRTKYGAFLHVHGADRNGEADFFIHSGFQTSLIRSGAVRPSPSNRV